MSGTTDNNLKLFGVEVRFRTGEASYTVKVRVKLGETFKRIKKHITESLDIQGRLAYNYYNFDDHPTRQLSEVYWEGHEIFRLTTEKKPRDLKQHQVELELPDSGSGVVKIARTTTIANLKHKIQDQYGILVEEQAIYVPSGQKECHQDTNVMLLPSPLLEVRLVRKEAQKKPPRVLRFRTPYDTKQSACVSKRKIYDSSPIHPKTFTGKEKPGTA